MGQFVLDDPPVSIEEEFEGSRVLCIRGQTEENLSITYRASLGRQFWNRRRHCLQARSPTRSSIYNTQIDFLQRRMTYR